MAKDTGEREEVPAQLVVRAVGYRGVPTPGLPFDERGGTIPHSGGRIEGSSNEYVVMRVLTARGPSDPAALHEFLAGQRQLALDRAGVAELLGGLEVAGLVSGSAVDGSGPVRLTEAGAALYAALSAKVGQVTTRLYADLDADDLATAHRVLGQVAERARDLP